MLNYTRDPGKKFVNFDFENCIITIKVNGDFQRFHKKCTKNGAILKMT